MTKVEKITRKSRMHIKISSFAMKTAQKELKNLLLPSSASDRKTVTFFWTTLYIGWAKKNDNTFRSLITFYSFIA